MLVAPPAERNAQCVICITHKFAAAWSSRDRPIIAKSPCKLLVAESALVPRRAHLLLVAEPLQVLGRDVHRRRLRRGRWWMWGFGGHEAIVSVLGGKFRPAPAWLRSFLEGRAVLMPSTPFAFSHVISRRFAYFRVVSFGIYAGEPDFCDGFDSRQLHKKECSSEHVLLEKFGLLGHILGTRQC